MRTYFLAILFCFIIINEEVTGGTTTDQVTSTARINQTIARASIDSIIRVRNNLQSKITKQNAFSVARQLEIQIDSMLTLKSIPTLPVYDIPKIKKRRKTGFWLTVTSAVLWGSMAYCEAHPPSVDVDSANIRSVRLLGDIGLLCTVLSGGYLIYNQGDLTLKNFRISSARRAEKNAMTCNDLLRIENGSIFKSNRDKIDGVRRNSVGKLDDEILEQVHNYYKAVDEIEAERAGLSFSEHGKGAMLKDLRNMLSKDGTTHYLDCKSECELTYDSVSGTIESSSLDFDIQLVHINSPVNCWITPQYFATMNPISKKSGSYVKDSEVRLYADTTLSSFVILNRGDKIKEEFEYGNLVKIEATYFSVERLNLITGTGIVDSRSISRSHVRSLHGATVWVKSDELNMRSGAGKSHSIVKSLERGNQLKLLKVINNWAFIEHHEEEYSSYYSTEKKIKTTRGWAYFPLLSSEKIAEYTWSQKFAIRREKQLGKLFAEHPYWSDEIKNLIRLRKIRRGMTKKQAEASWGYPDDINKTVGSWGVHEQWVYPNYQYLYFENGTLTSWQN